MSSFSNIIARGNTILYGRDTTLGVEESDTAVDLMIAFLGVSFFALVMVALLLVLRRAKRERQMQNETLPHYNDIKHDGNHTRHLTIQTADGRSSILVLNGRPMLADPNSPPHSPNNVPEIHITFPDEQDENGRSKKGSVVVVRVGETSVGLEPVKDEQLPAYEKESSTGFYSIDMDQIGGLKEKDRSQFS
ncbi:uncharacterized protein GGS25DRAFT_476103 [Hypoxylon fragiforme]|uniref:uncharacterized protein n=1 Tax=Hypoxylon fragiforme TaxID=63214 RepID=UPI0020C6D9EF|nr:uncharacterized protein GGS25DRAFT_476103 [Hypoxylon fragiforme]KAI2612602.1 hypothetical protein GGS25DRAFT_476103 [Hypoxylon fragiforme]